MNQMRGWGVVAVLATWCAQARADAPLSFLSVETINGVDVSADGKWIAAASSYGNLKILSAADLSIAREVKSEGGPLAAVSFSHDGTLVAYGDAKGNVVVLDTATGKESFRLPAYAMVTRLRFSPVDLRLAVSAAPAADYKKTLVDVWDLATHKLERSLVKSSNAQYMPSGLAFSRDGSKLAIGISNGQHGFEIYELAHGKRVARVLAKKDVVAIDFAADGQHVVGGGTDRKISLWNSKGKASWSVPWGSGAEDYVMDVAVSADGKSVAVVGRGGNTAVRIYGMADGKLVQELGTHNPVGNAVRFTPDGARVVAAFTTYGDIAKVAVVQVFTR